MTCVISTRGDTAQTPAQASALTGGQVETRAPVHPTVPSAPRILITDPLAQEGIALLRTELPEAHVDEQLGLTPAQVRARIGSYSALIVRHETRVTDDLLAAAHLLKVVGCAAAGVDTIDLEAAARRGIPVVNAPEGEVIAVAEHTIAMLLALARRLPLANNSTKAGRWDKSRLLGVEVSHKVLGIIGLGKVGTEVARRAQGLSMRVLASDPQVSSEQARHVGVTLLSLEEVLHQADFLTLHASLSGDPNELPGSLAPMNWPCSSQVHA